MLRVIALLALFLTRVAHLPGRHNQLRHGRKHRRMWTGDPLRGAYQRQPMRSPSSPIVDRPTKGELYRGKGPAADASLDVARKADRFLADEFPELEGQWSGVLEVAPSREMPEAHGYKNWSCEITLNEDAAKSIPRRQDTLLHEMLHSLMPPGKDYKDKASKYADNVGWEEAPVEQMMRLLRPRFSSAQDLPDTEHISNDLDADHPYNRYIYPLENMRTKYGLGEPEDFWRELYTQPLEDRPIWLLTRAKQESNGTALNSDVARDFVAVNNILKNRA